MNSSFLGHNTLRYLTLVLCFCLLSQACTPRKDDSHPDAPCEQIFCLPLTLIGDLSRTTVSTDQGLVSIAITQSQIHCPSDSSEPWILSLRVKTQKFTISPTQQSLSFPYFVALIDPMGNILAKEDFTATATIDKNQSKGRDLIKQPLSLPFSSAPKGMLVTGLQLPSGALDTPASRPNRRPHFPKKKISRSPKPSTP